MEQMKIKQLMHSRNIRFTNKIATNCYCIYNVINIGVHHLSLLFKCYVQTLEEDVEKFVTVVEDLGRVAKKLITRGHFDSTNISARQVCIIDGCSYFLFTSC